MSTSTPAYRISAQDVIDVIDFDPTITDLTPFIDAAEELVNMVVAQSINGSPIFVTYTANQLAKIEIYLTAHLVAIRDPRYTAERIGAAGASYAVQVGLNLAGTQYGQQALLLDVNGGLAWVNEHISKGKRTVPSVTHLGVNLRRWYGYPWRFIGLFGAGM